MLRANTHLVRRLLEFGTVSVHPRHGVTQCTGIAINTPFSTCNNSTTIAPIDNALAAIRALKPGEKLVYQEIAD
ncbi:uncharacterized protein M421DRAFT_406685 [Didymella exigua CBS 183.55]|uniref:Uncharacterized protein n=1 Tax=Didymella exigua CBS 183.55 TaxID=1150837 RepID=A0A6A5R9Y6_9PLEO|nr:uncharacterized protein M421DRAFT_406685 [Didymella exigua CBS 183.55]KAF1923476.1 hypothetical protein M421DRAFT_406685 [Didymella exigua CBS 183.55]